MAQSTERPAFSYDRVAYPSVLLPDQSPDRLRVSALLHGLDAADPTTASVLEIGCGTGLNLLAHATAMPRSRVVGFDLSHTAIARGQEAARAARLENADLHVGDILTYPRDGERFDYIVCHGVFSWVPQHVRIELLALIAARLAPGGIAYLSFESLPAAAAKAAIVSFLRRGMRDGDTVEEAAERAARTIAALSRNQTEGSPLRPALDEMTRMQPWRKAGYFYHDWLAEHYAPIGLDDFIALTASSGLALAGVTSNRDVGPFELDEDGEAILAAAGNDAAQRLLTLEMLQGPHRFQRALLVSAAAPPPAAADVVRNLSFSFEGWRREVETDGSPAVRYGVGEDDFITTNHPASIAVFDALVANRPNETPYAELQQRAGIDHATLDGILESVAAGDVVLLHGSAQPYVASPGERPRVSALSRFLLADSNRAISLRGVAIEAGQPETSLCLQLCDGTRTRAEIAVEMSRRLNREIPAEMVEIAIAAFAGQRVFEA